MQDTLLYHVQSLTFYASELVALIAGLVLFVRSRKIGFLLLGITALAYLFIALLARLIPGTSPWIVNSILTLTNIGQLVAWLILAAEYLIGRNRSVPAAAGVAIPATTTAAAPTCANCNTPLIAASRFCAKCGQATGA